MTPEEKLNFTSKYLSPCRTIGLKRKSKSPGSSTPLRKSNKLNNVNDEENKDNRKEQTSSSDLCESDVPGDQVHNGFKSSQTSFAPKRSFERLQSRRGDKILRDSNIDESKERFKLPNECFVETKVGSETVCLTDKRYSVTDSQPEFDSPQCSFPKNELQPSQSKSFMKSPKNTSINNPARSDSNLLSSKIPTNIVQVVLRINEKHEQLQHFKNNKVYSDKHDITTLMESTERWKKACIEALERLHAQLRLRGDTSTTLGDLIQAHSIPPHLLSFDTDSQQFI